MFKRYGCGCIGFVVRGTGIDPSDKIIWLVKPCDGDPDDPEYCLEYSTGRSSTFANKSSEKLTEDEMQVILRDLGQLVSDGYRMRTIQRLLSL